MMNTKTKAALAGVTLSLLGALTYPYWSSDEYTVRVTDKVPKDGSYLIYTDKGTFEVTDTWHYLRFTSSDFYGKIERNQTYRIKASGVRLGFLSWYENIISAERVQELPPGS